MVTAGCLHGARRSRRRGLCMEPLPLLLKALSPDCWQGWGRSFGQESALHQLLLVQNKANFSSHQPRLFTDFRAALSSQMPLSVTLPPSHFTNQPELLRTELRTTLVLKSLNKIFSSRKPPRILFQHPLPLTTSTENSKTKTKDMLISNTLSHI